MAAPVVAVFGLIDRAAGHAVIRDRSRFGGSWAWFGFMLAASLAFFTGTVLIHRAACDVLPGADLRLILLLVLAGGVTYYALGRFSMAHAFEFAAVAALVRTSTGLYRASAVGVNEFRWIAGCAAATALCLMVRPANLNLLLMPPAVLLSMTAWRSPAPDTRRLLRATALLAGTTLLALLPLAVFNLHFFGGVYPSPASVYGEDVKALEGTGVFTLAMRVLLLLPNIVPLLIGPEFGLVFTNPVVVFGVPGLVVLTLAAARGRNASAVAGALLLLLVAAFSVALVLYWRTTASAYGYRYLLVLLPVAVLGAAALLHASRQRSPGAYRAVAGALVVFGAISVTSQLFFQANENLGTRPGLNTFGEYHEYSGAHYLPALAREVARPATWSELAARRYPGFIAVGLLRALHSLDVIKPEQRARLDRRYGSTPAVVWLQTLLLLLCWVGFGAYVGSAGVRIPAPQASECVTSGH